MAGRGSLGEFELIARYLAPLAADAPGAFGLEDDAAVIAAPADSDLVVTTDAMVEGIHFLKTDGAGRIARKLLRVNLSDLAAKGAEPIGYQLVLGLPAPVDEAWLADFAAGLAQDQQEFAFPLYGGDTIRSPSGLMLAVTAFGHVQKGGVLQRSGGQAGDDLYVTGTIGDAALGLEVKLKRRPVPAAAAAAFDARLHLPTPRLAVGRALRGTAHAAMDVSDGLVQDAGHIASASGLRVVIDASLVPFSDAARPLVAQDTGLLDVMLGGGDDYELLFSASPRNAASIRQIAMATGVAITRIGRLEAGSGVLVETADGRPITVGRAGFQHFGGGGACGE
ncbi:MAG TPA: thiamine-phosphate kinase [Ferrovibrio sp.]|uniref:thiamine-phosphate kinase n=1 Tax=Ferrovibrio sp. TaxID=1917215 RepID=UPI002ED3CE71